MPKLDAMRSIVEHVQLTAIQYELSPACLNWHVGLSQSCLKCPNTNTPTIPEWVKRQKHHVGREHRGFP